MGDGITTNLPFFLQGEILAVFQEEVKAGKYATMESPDAAAPPPFPLSRDNKRRENVDLPREQKQSESFLHGISPPALLRAMYIHSPLE